MENKLISYDPSNGEIVGAVEITDVKLIPQMVAKSKQAQKKWGALSVDERIKYIEKAASLLGEKARELGTLLSREMGKGLSRSVGEVQGCAYDAVYRAESVKEAIKTQIYRGNGVQTAVEYNPLGVCAVITPWNYPVSMGHWLIIPALAAGNTVVYKPSEETPLAAQGYADIFNKVLPSGVLQVIHGTDEQGKALVNEDVDLIAFTGSQAVGKEIMKDASKSLKRLIMELGGNDPLIVMKDADIDRAVRFAVANSFENAGQMCVSTERVFVDEEIADEFERKAAQYAQYYKIGPWNDKNANIGPIINEKQRNNIIRQIEDAVANGAKVLSGGGDHPERYILPTVLTNITENMLIAKEETFGPVVCITRYSDINEAVKAANNTDYGLGAVVFGEKDAETIARQLEAGMVGINQGVGGIGDTPWVGAKQSGFGYHGSPDGHRQFTQVRVITKNI